MSEYFIAFTDEEPHAGSTVGSINEYLSGNYHHDRAFNLMAWMCSAIRDLPGDRLEVFVTDNLNSSHCLRKALAQYAVNIHFNELQSLFWRIDDYSNLNYSELYDMVRNNAQYFDPSNVKSFVNNVNRSFKRFNPDYARACRYSLLKLMPIGFSEVESALDKNHVENESRYGRPEDRGKAVVISASWGSEEHNPVEYSSLSEVLEVFHSGNLSFHERRAVETYLENNPDELVEQPEAIDDIPCVFYNIISKGIETYGADPETIFRIYSRIVHVTVENNPELLVGCLFYFKRWSKNNNLEDRLCEVLVDVAERNVEQFCNDRVVETDNMLVQSSNYWFTGS